jgi:hypothetical protein
MDFKKCLMTVRLTKSQTTLSQNAASPWHRIMKSNFSKYLNDFMALIFGESDTKTETGVNKSNYVALALMLFVILMLVIASL